MAEAAGVETGDDDGEGPSEAGSALVGKVCGEGAVQAAARQSAMTTPPARRRRREFTGNTVARFVRPHDLAATTPPSSRSVVREWTFAARAVGKIALKVKETYLEELLQDATPVEKE